MDEINSKTIEVGTTLKVYPSTRSHEKNPYFVIVIESTDKFFTTVIASQSKGKTIYDHKVCFEYGDKLNWDYHKGRFEIVSK